MALKNKKELGQNWLKDRTILDTIAESGDLNNSDTVLEIGPGLGTLTSSLLKRAKKVIAVEFDKNLAQNLLPQFPGKNLEVFNEDILHFNLDKLPKNYKVVANVPYYITSKIIQNLLMANNKPSKIVILIQKEVAERIVAEKGNMSILAVSVQVFAKAKLGIEVPREFFTPPPRVDSQVVVLETRERNLIEIFNLENNCEISEKEFFRIVKAGFAAKRKKIIKSLSANLAISKEQAAEILEKCEVSPDLRAQDLEIEKWLKIAKVFYSK